MTEHLAIVSEQAGEKPQSSYLVDVAEAARITGLPKSLIRKSFMAEDKRPKYAPDPPPHKRIGRSVYILADQLFAWVKNLENTEIERNGGLSKRGRPTVRQRIARRD